MKWLAEELLAAKEHHDPQALIAHIELGQDPVIRVKRLAVCAHREANLYFPRFTATTRMVDYAAKFLATYPGWNKGDFKPPHSEAFVVLKNALSAIHTKSLRRDARWSTSTVPSFEDVLRRLDQLT